MKATELRIGNLVNFNVNNKPIRVTIGTLEDVELNNKHVNPPYFYQGIPLTEELLIKCGFELDSVNSNSHQKFFDDAFRIEMSRIGDDEDWVFNIERIRVEYLHQLQNAIFVLSDFKEELNIELEIQH